mmetsp:Transcript_7843/g.21791  ORF Transcript_7843/g.21791 Transcript_7843/m.21791 type:complete len:80 (+) Transcript_7843:2416-2655(+)
MFILELFFIFDESAVIMADDLTAKLQDCRFAFFSNANSWKNSSFHWNSVRLRFSKWIHMIHMRPYSVQTDRNLGFVDHG